MAQVSHEATMENGSHDLAQGELEYVLNELDMLERRMTFRRDRIEQLAQFYLTALVAIGGGALLIWQVAGADKVMGCVVLGLASLASLLLGGFVFLRYTDYQEDRADCRMRSYLMRKELADRGMRLPMRIASVDPSDQIGYSSFAVACVMGLSVFLAFLASLGIAAGFAFVLLLSGREIFDRGMPGAILYTIWYAFPTLLGFVLVFGVSQGVFRGSRRRIANRTGAQLEAEG